MLLDLVKIILYDNLFALFQLKIFLNIVFEYLLFIESSKLCSEIFLDLETLSIFFGVFNTEINS